MSLVLTGGTGFVGYHLRYALAEDQVVLMGRVEPVLRANESHARVDLSKPVEAKSLAGGKVLCHLAYSREAETKNIGYNQHLLDAVNACTDIEQVILLSSISVYGANASPLVYEESSCKPIDTYARTKLACEMLWRKGLRNSCKLTVLQPTEIVGVGGTGMRPLIRDALERPLLGTVKRSILYHRSLHYIAVGNVVAAIVFCLRRPQATSCETFIVSEDHRPENRSYAAMQDLVRRISNKHPLPGLAMPQPILSALGKVTGHPLRLTQIYTSKKLRDAGFRYATSIEDEVRRLVGGWYGG
jgi:nucleoside-diphosphate-sugar epimerase